jgi:ankyrin repeat protein
MTTSNTGTRHPSYYTSYAKTTSKDYIISRLKALKAKIAKVNPMAIRDNKWSDLHLAVGFKEINLVKTLCDEKNINSTDAKCRTPLELAILGRDLETVKFLVQMGGKIAPNMYGWSAIHLAIKIGNLEIVKYLYENTEFKKYDKYGLSLLDWAKNIGNKQVVQFFQYSPKMKTPLELAVESKNISSIKALISKGAKFDIKSELGYKIFDLAINSEDVRLIEYLVNHMLVGKNTGQQTLLEKVTQIYDKNINVSKLAKVLIKNGAEFDKALGQKLLQKAVYADDLELVETLYDKGINVKYQDQLGRTALNHAIKANCGEELLKFLIEHGDCNSRDKSGSTPLHWAANNHHTIATKLLLEADACSYIPDYLGQTPLSLAEYYGHDDIAGILGAVVHGS